MKVKLCPAQIAGAEALRVTTGLGITVKLTVVDNEQIPFDPMRLAVNCPAMYGGILVNEDTGPDGFEFEILKGVMMV